MRYSVLIQNLVADLQKEKILPECRDRVFQRAYREKAQNIFLEL